MTRFYLSQRGACMAWLLALLLSVPLGLLAQQVTSFTLINSQTDADIGPLEDGDVIDLNQVGTRLNVRANTEGTIKQIHFLLNGKKVRRESYAPYALAGDNTNGDYWNWTPPVGTHVIEATPHDGNQALGTKKKITIQVVRGAPPSNDPPSNDPPGDITEGVVNFTLIDAEADADIGLLNNGDTLYLTKLGPSLNIRANTEGAVSSVKFKLNGNPIRTEKLPPYALYGDIRGNYKPWNPPLGTHTVTATAYSGSQVAGSERSVTFVVTDSESDSNPDPEPEPDSDPEPDPDPDPDPNPDPDPDPNPDPDPDPNPDPEPEPQPNDGEMVITGELKKWHKITLSFAGPEHKETDVNPNPFLDYRLEVTFKQGNRTYKVPGYFAADGNAAESSAASGNIWRVHFAPDGTGEWSYEVSFRKGDKVAVSDSPNAGSAVSPLNGMKGTFEVATTDKQGRDHRAKGRLEYVDKHYLQFAETGEYFLKGGPDAPENFLAYEDFDNTPDNGPRNDRKTWAPHRKDWSKGDPSWSDGKGTEIIGALNYLASKGMNAFSFLTLSYKGDDRNVFPWVNPPNYLQYDCSKLDQWEIVFSHADKLGLYLHFKTQETENDQLLDNGNLGTERKLYYRELIARFGHHLALNWNLGEENTQTNAQRKAMAEYFAEHDPYRHHLVIHTYPKQQDDVYKPMLGNKSDLTGVSIQTNWKSVYKDTKKWCELSAEAGKPWVVANDEQATNGASIGVPPDLGYPGYNGSDPDMHDIRKQVLWGNLMAGGAGVEYYFGYELPHSDLTAEDYRSRDKSWEYVNHALTFFQKNVPFETMSSDDDLVSRGWCLADPGEVYVVYLPDGGSANLNLPNGKTFTVEWFDPRNGGILRAGSTTTITGNGATNIGNPPSKPNEDWAVLIKAKTTSTNKIPVAVIKLDKTSGTAPLTVSLDASNSVDQDGQIVKYEWLIDGTKELTGVLTSTTFTTAGNHQIRLTVTDNTGATHSAQRTVSVSAPPNPEPPSGGDECDIHEEVDGLLVAEMESANLIEDWNLKTSGIDFTGNGAIYWDGSQSLQNPGNGVMTYNIKINTPGTYRFEWRVAVGKGNKTSDHNDTWLKIDADDFYGLQGNHRVRPRGRCETDPDADCPRGATKDGFFKIYGGKINEFQWKTYTSDSDAHRIYADFNKPGIYQITISARSSYHIIDRMVLFNDQVSRSKAIDPNTPVTRPCSNSNLAELPTTPAAPTNFAQSTSTITALPELNLYPNPTRGDITVEINVDTPGRLRVIGTDGRTYYETDQFDYETILPTNRLPQGLYLVEWTNGQDRIVKRMMKQ